MKRCGDCRNKLVRLSEEYQKSVNYIEYECPDCGNHYYTKKEHKPFSTKDLKINKHRAICKELSDIYKKKNHDYGDSFAILYEKFGMQSTVIRLWDKLLRLETLLDQDRQVEDESIEDTLKDLANYCIITLMERGE